eukprot:CAMPEP_0197689158 /NCGR_PEP_ID=MMETSP1338-20131121/106445_1 /TAXON_ID=43686 ORGANISM="Pelagodinium beii, Strain RCC1491" /NCGR_SAMPLE_ID=MMETSP1338 /ASSEMBLY_ACC=CAM_ASM_000754 /LENGTH=54 /DNA_ID=CAMNT_0043271465 /DNA_START=174 /DNA_END=338 /DNA_ORIENTATION=-
MVNFDIARVSSLQPQAAFLLLCLDDPVLTPESAEAVELSFWKLGHGAFTLSLRP